MGNNYLIWISKKYEYSSEGWTWKYNLTVKSNSIKLVGEPDIYYQAHETNAISAWWHYSASETWT